MKVENLERAVNLKKTLEKLETALAKLSAFNPVEQKNSTDDIEGGYSAYISRQRDGSGTIVDLSGCYVAEDLVDATLEVLKCNIELRKKQLLELGIEL